MMDQQEPPKADERGARRRILVADDDPIVLKFLSALLTDAGYDVLTAEDGEKALQRIREARPDLVVLDLVMPYRDGFEICRTVRENPATRGIPIIVLSVKEKEGDVVRCFEMGADDYIRKPFNALELLARINKVMEQRSRRT